jgi:hypothetical protein
MAFSTPTIHIVAGSVGYRCSSCRAATVGPHTDPDKVSGVGEAAHIVPASDDGPRCRFVDPILSGAERTKPSNGIWLCANCHTRVDRDPEKYAPEVLRQWKVAAEKLAEEELGKSPENRKGGSIAVSASLRAGDGAWEPGGDISIGAGDGLHGASGGNIHIGSGSYRAGDGGVAGRGGSIIIKAGDAR